MNVEVDEEYLSSWPERFIPEALKTSMTIIDDEVSESRERQGYDPERIESNNGEDVDDTEDDDEGASDLMVIDGDHEGDDINSVRERHVDDHRMIRDKDIEICGGGSVLSNVDGLLGTDQSQLAEMVGATLEKSRFKGTDEPYIKYVHSSQPLNQYDTEEYFTGSFPTIF